MNTKKIIIIGAGWYGLNSYLFIKEKYKHYEVFILEKNSEIFENSSCYNQNRLHLGYHYPRSKKTRDLCNIGYNEFIKRYRHIVDFIDNNYYCISKNSLIDYQTYIKIFSDDNNYDHSFKINNFLENIDGNIINTKEKIINSQKAKIYFKDKIDDKDIKLNYKVENIEIINDKIKINNEIECDILLDCTYNQLGLQKNFIYELTISLIYKKINNTQFDALTIMDGDFFSLFPRDIDSDKYTLTHVKYTPLLKSKDINDILNYDNKMINIDTIKEKMEKDVKKYYSNFLKDFKYIDYFISYKCKSDDNTDIRDCNINKNKNIISVNCGKITGIFKFENYLKNLLII